jgi:hypothetical protein
MDGADTHPVTNHYSFRLSWLAIALSIVIAVAVVAAIERVTASLHH